MKLNNIESTLSNISNNLKSLTICFEQIHKNLYENRKSFQSNWLEQWYKDFEDLLKEMNSLKSLFTNSEGYSTLRFMAKEINEMKKTLESIKEKGINKKIHFDLTLDGHHMIEKNNIFNENDEELLNEKNLSCLMEGLTEKQKQTIKLRFGLFGERTHSSEEIAKKLDVTTQQIINNLNNSIRKFCHPSRKKFVTNLKNQELKDYIYKSR
jgi:DNA-directed RNA polymerase sigma subunit (sigma70/sigma32)